MGTGQVSDWPLNLPPSGFKVCAVCAGRGCFACDVRRGVGVVRESDRNQRPSLPGIDEMNLIVREPRRQGWVDFRM